MPPIINVQGISKTYGVSPLFRNISFTVSEGSRIGLIGPNGAGKSTLLQLLAGRVRPDAGDVALRKRARLSYVAQHSEFAPGRTVQSVIEDSMHSSDVPEMDRPPLLAETLGRAGFENFQAEAASLSGGWRKRLAIVEGAVQKPDVLLLDEPTNHLDLAGIRWLESMLQAGGFAYVVVSHDRYLLENAADEVVELNRMYEDGLFRMAGNYSSFLEARESYLEAQGRRRESLQNRVQAEIAWLRRGAKARRTKAKAQVDNARDLIDKLAEVNARSRTSTANIDFSGTERRTKRLIELENAEYAIGGRTLFSALTFPLGPGMRLGLAGPNGSGKTTLLRLLRGEIESQGGSVRRADHLRIVYFDQNRSLPPGIPLRRALAPEGDSVVYQDRLIHVAAWADRFLFSGEALNQPVGRLSGGERARVLIAQLMLQPADILLLDEPTNDLDIPTLEVLEESLLEFKGALVVVTHDRYLMDRICTDVIGLDGFGGSERFADYSQYEAWQQARELQVAERSARLSQPASRPPSKKRKLSYLEAKEYEGMEEAIADAEKTLEACRAALADPLIASDGPMLIAASMRLDEAQIVVDRLYSRWAELEEKQS